MERFHVIIRAELRSENMSITEIRAGIRIANLLNLDFNPDFKSARKLPAVTAIGIHA